MHSSSKLLVLKISLFQTIQMTQELIGPKILNQPPPQEAHACCDEAVAGPESARSPPTLVHSRAPMSTMVMLSEKERSKRETAGAMAPPFSMFAVIQSHFHPVFIPAPSLRSLASRVSTGQRGPEPPPLSGSAHAAFPPCSAHSTASTSGLL